MIKVEKVLSYRVNGETVVVGSLRGTVDLDGIRDVIFRPHGMLGWVACLWLVDETPIGWVLKDSEAKAWSISFEKLDEFLKLLDERIPEICKKASDIALCLLERGFSIVE